jgi:organic hydroperoxide reductase OsmC/OhrA
MMKLKFKQASCRVEMDYFLRGSVLKGTVESGCTETRVLLRLETDEENQDRVNMLIRNAKRGCFAESMIKANVPMKSLVEVNGISRSIAGITD